MNSINKKNIKWAVRNFLNANFFLFLCLFLGSVLGLTCPCQAVNLTEEEISSGGVILRHDLKIPVGSQGESVQHQIVQAGSPLEDIPGVISQTRESMGLAPDIGLSQRERFFQEFPWEIRKSQDQTTPMPGRVTKIFVRKGDSIEMGSPLYTIEVMKMECMVRSSVSGTIKKIYQDVGEIIGSGVILLSLLPRSSGWQTLSSEVILANESLLLSLFPWGPKSSIEPPNETPPENSGGQEPTKGGKESLVRETLTSVVPFPSLSSGPLRRISFFLSKEDLTNKGHNFFAIFSLFGALTLDEHDFPGLPGTSPLSDFLKHESLEIGKGLKTQPLLVSKGKKAVLEFIKRGGIASSVPKTSFPAHSSVHAKSALPIWLGALLLFLLFQGLAQRTRYGFKGRQVFAMRFIKAEALIKNGLIPSQNPSNQNLTPQQKRKAS